MLHYRSNDFTLYYVTKDYTLHYRTMDYTCYIIILLYMFRYYTDD